MTEIVWGDEIAVDGKRPAWLEDMDWVTFRNTAAYSKKWSEQRLAQDIAFGGGCGSKPYVTLIRLPADHPHYATLRPATAPSPSEVAPEVVERMIALVRRMAGNNSMGEPYEEDRAITYNSDHYYEARAVFALLFPDPDLADAKRIAAGYCGNVSVDAVLNGIKHGRALEKEAGR